MKKYTAFLLKHRKMVIAFFLVASVICALLSLQVQVNYDFSDYLPDDAPSTVAINVMQEEFDQAIPNLRIMLHDVTVAEALSYKAQFAAVDGVEEVNWLDDSINIYQPLQMADTDTVEAWYKDNNALFQLTIDESKETTAVSALREIIGEENYMSGEAVSSALVPVLTSQEIQKITILVVCIVLVILFLCTTSWAEPIFFMITIGVAVLLNRGTNLMFGTISFVTNAAGSILQLAVSMDYSIFLLHRFEEKKQLGLDPIQAMIEAESEAVSSILSSGLTTVTGFAALILMSFKIGPDMGWVMSKAIALSLFTVLTFLPAFIVSFYQWVDKTKHRSFLPSFGRFANVVYKMRVPAVICGILLILPCYLASQNNTFYYGGGKVYSSQKSQIGRDMIAIEEEFGISNPVVLMVPLGEEEKEIALNYDLKHLDGVSSVISYVNTVGEAVPEQYLDSATLAQLRSEHYSRFVLTLNTAEGLDNCFSVIQSIKDTASYYYSDTYHFAGDLASTSDLKETITQDMLQVNLLSIGFVFLILIFTFRSISIPVILTLVIEISIWINLSVPYFSGEVLHYISYLIISSIQLGATIDYAILLTERYTDLRTRMSKRQAITQAICLSAGSILTSASILTFGGFMLGNTTNLVIAQLGVLVGRGAIISFILVMLLLPGMLVLLDRFIEKTTHKANFYKGA